MLKRSHRSLSVICPHTLSLQTFLGFLKPSQGIPANSNHQPHGAIIIAKKRDLINHILVDCSDSPGRNLDLKDGDMDDIHTQYTIHIQLNNIWICK